MNPAVETKTAPAEVEDPYRYGWRYVRREGSNGTVDYEQVPLTAEDVLHPQEGDHIVQNDAHSIDCDTIGNALKTQAAKQKGWLVLKDHGVDWGVEGIKAFCPDLVVFDGGTAPKVGAIFYVAETDAKTVLVVEVTSLTTRKNDLGVKLEAYERFGVPLYVIVDRGPDWTGQEVQLLAYQASPKGYVRLRPDRRGWLWLEPVRIWLAIEENRAVCYDENEKRFEDYSIEWEERQAAEARAEAAEKRLRDLEAEFQRLRDKS